MEALVAHLNSLKFESPSHPGLSNVLSSPNREPNSLLDLPVELKLQILSELRTKEIVCCRQVCQHFCDLVDTESNTVLLTKPVEARARSRLQRFVDHYIQYSADTTFLEALSRVFEHRGFWLSQQTYDDELLTFAAHWLHNCRGIRQPSTYFLSSLHVIAARLATFVMRIHAHYNLPIRYDTSPVIKQDGFLMEAGTLGYQLGFDNATLIRLFRRARRGALKGRMRSKYKNDRDGEGMPSWPLTPLFSRGQARNQFGRKIKSVCSVVELVEIFRMPGFLDLKHFSVCAETEWAYERVKEAVNGKTLEPLVKVAVLEDLWIF